MNIRLTLALVIWALGRSLPAQIPIVPLWVELSGPDGGGTSKVAWDATTQRILWAYSQPNYQQPLRRFDIQGNDLTPLPQFMLPSPDSVPDGHSTLRKMSAHADTLDIINFFDYNPIDLPYTLTSAITIPLNGGPTMRAKNIKYETFTDVIRDDHGSVAASGTTLRTFAANGWPKGFVDVLYTSDRLAADEARIYCGHLPHVRVVDRNTLAILPPIDVPASSFSTRTFLQLQGNVLYYAAQGSNAILDIGAVDTSGTLIWSKSEPFPGGMALTGFVIDALGNSWVSVGRRLYGTDPTGTLSDEYQFGWTIDDLATSGSHLILTGRDEANHDLAYLAVWGAPVVTGIREVNDTGITLFPNPASSMISIQDIDVGVERISIMDATGRSLIEFTGSFKGKLDFSTADLAPGSYFIRLSGPEGNATLPFQVVR